MRINNTESQYYCSAACQSSVLCVGVAVVVGVGVGVEEEEEEEVVVVC